MNINKFKIENFCEEHNTEFKQYYDYLNNPLYVSIFINYLPYLNHEIIKKKIYKMIIENHNYVLDRINKIDILVNYYKKNNLINKSEIGKFFNFYLEHRKKINLNNKKHLFNLFYKLINYNDIILLLKEIFYIFSNYRACIYYLTPSINFHNTKKSIINKVIISFRDNLNTLNQIISKIYLGNKNPWGSIYYSSSYAMFETLLILKKYYKNPLQILNIKFTIIKKCENENLIENLCNNYLHKKMKISAIDKKINKITIKNISQFILILKKEGYDLWFVIFLIFDTIYESYEFENVSDSLLLDHKNTYYQKKNNMFGLMCFILVDNNFISNINIFNNFND
jgi:hypothetical protein